MCRPSFHIERRHIVHYLRANLYSSIPEAIMLSLQSLEGVGLISNSTELCVQYKIRIHVFVAGKNPSIDLAGDCVIVVI
jgi:hypothetical protein